MDDIRSQLHNKPASGIIFRYLVITCHPLLTLFQAFRVDRPYPGAWEQALDPDAPGFWAEYNRSSSEKRTFATAVMSILFRELDSIATISELNN